MKPKHRYKNDKMKHLLIPKSKSRVCSHHFSDYMQVFLFAAAIALKHKENANIILIHFYLAYIDQKGNKNIFFRKKRQFGLKKTTLAYKKNEAIVSIVP